MCAMLMFNLYFPTFFRQQRDHVWKPKPLRPSNGQRLVVLGLGRYRIARCRESESARASGHRRTGTAARGRRRGRPAHRGARRGGLPRGNTSAHGEHTRSRWGGRARFDEARLGARQHLPRRDRGRESSSARLAMAHFGARFSMFSRRSRSPPKASSGIWRTSSSRRIPGISKAGSPKSWSCFAPTSSDSALLGRSKTSSIPSAATDSGSSSSFSSLPRRPSSDPDEVDRQNPDVSRIAVIDSSRL